MKVKSNWVKFTTAAALAVTGFGVANLANSNATAATVKAATKKVKINYVPGYGINIWDNYENPNFTGERIKHGKTVAVLSSAIDQKGNTWYQIGENQWIQARYTVKPGTKIKAVSPQKKSVKQAEKVVDLANAEVGKAYAWGGNGPQGFDCSGLAQYVYSKAAGMNLSRTTYSQVKEGKKVSLQNLKPGDLLFWGSSTAPYHVGIYVGNNQYVHAATPTQGVVKENLSSYFYPSVAKRVLD
ncbi:Cell wall-associated hydrolase [Lactobacillus helsingborgensis]|uniref:C40 family peptidase n=1 Tax=Lactobacillus helsingborgensis TaxID=1218494 RepID=A0AA47GGM6_9LACO|nr:MULTISPECIES: C40 family peptidase [Lactobacillus]KJY62919.1 Cell wall-associated hydrolase [Lactobacillus helsingborgensis]MBI0110304.1 C40 family peptidase [Lactobacillus sp. W8093]MCT6811857.1 C40 family peptidase [Lactobacillus helsingborgensis]MCT6827881.1 C40 family peptidase [Lactobacillus helsingborgensis]MCT6847042.1 C40 family peptidase [Lactobacillus helsingborgensis]